MNGGILAVATRCSDPSRLAEFERWYARDHLADVLTVDHFVGAQLFRAAGRRPPVGHGADEGVDFLGLYEMDTTDVDSAMDLLWQNDPRVEALGRNPHLGIAVLSHTYVPVSDRMTKAAAFEISPLPRLRSGVGD